MKNPNLRTRAAQKRAASRFQAIFWRTILALFFTAITLGAAAFLFPQQFLTIDSGEIKADALVVLGGGDGRAERAAELYNASVAPTVIATGFGDCASNIERMEKKGVPASAIIAEPRALTTRENALLSIPILRKMGAHRIILVTSWYHSRRALATFEHFAPDLRFYSRPSYFEYEPQKQIREGFDPHVNIEYAKLLVYWFKYGVYPL